MTNGRAHLHGLARIYREKELGESLTALSEMLELKEVPKRIEAYDVSETSGDNVVGVRVVFKDLALEFGELQGSDLRKLTIREHYGFVDLYRPQAERLKQCLNGIEYNGNPLPIEFAAALSRKPPRRRGPHRQHGRDQRHGGN